MPRGIGKSVNEYRSKNCPKGDKKLVVKKNTGTVTSIKMTEKFNIEDTYEIKEAEEERFLLFFEKTFNEVHEKNLKEESLDCENGVVTDFLTMVAKKMREQIPSDVNVVRQQSS